MLAFSWLYPFCIAPLRGKVEACFHIRFFECQQNLSPVKSKPQAFPQIHFYTISSSLEVCYATIQFVRRKNLRYNHVGLFVVISCVLAGKGTCLSPQMVRTTNITDVMLRRSSRIKPTPMVFNNKITPALSATIKLTHLINLPHDFPTHIFPCFEQQKHWFSFSFSQVPLGCQTNPNGRPP